MKKYYKLRRYAPHAMESPVREIASPLGGKHKTKQGFTLVELLIYMGILSILLYILTQVFTSILDTQLESDSHSRIQQDSKYIVSRLSHDILLSDDIITPATIGAQSNTLVVTRNGQSYTYSLAGEKLELTDSIGTNALNGHTTEISNVAFRRLGTGAGNNSVTATFTITSKVTEASGNETKTIQATFGTR